MVVDLQTTATVDVSTIDCLDIDTSVREEFCFTNLGYGAPYCRLKGEASHKLRKKNPMGLNPEFQLNFPWMEEKHLPLRPYFCW